MDDWGPPTQSQIEELERRKEALNPRSAVLWYIYNWTTREKRVVLQPPAVTELGKDEVVYHAMFTIEPPVRM